MFHTAWSLPQVTGEEKQDLAAALDASATEVRQQRSDEYQNDWDGELKVTCDNVHAINYVGSLHDNDREDRIWSWRCKQLQGVSPLIHADCEWTGPQNEYDEPLIFKCNDDGYVAGVRSVHDNHHEDRVWEFYCCKTTQHSLKRCGLSGFQNDYDGPLSFPIRDGSVISGVYSVHDNHKE